MAQRTSFSVVRPERGSTVEGLRSKREKVLVDDEEDFGIKEYVVPRGELQRLPIPVISSIRNKQKRLSFIDDEIKRKMSIPGPSKYLKVVEWCGAPVVGN